MNDTYLSPELHTLLDDCLAQILRGDRTLEDCLADFPDQADELRPALQVALLTARLKSPEMTAAGVDALEMRLRGQMMAQHKHRTAGRFAPLAKIAAMVGIAFLLLLGTGGGAVAASANTIPGDTLYTVKRLWESIVLALSPLTGDIDELWLWLAQNRLYEAEQLAAQGRLDDEALIELYEAMAMSITLADAESAPQVMAYLDEARDTLAGITAAPEINAIYEHVVEIAEPVLREDGRLQPPEQMTLRPADLETVAATLTPTLTPTEPPASATPTSTDTPVPSATFTPTVTDTATPRLPPTATRTTTPTLTPTATVTPTITPTATWTPLPLPTRIDGGGAPIIVPTVGGGDDHDQPGGLPTIDGTVRYRETESAVYQTQTAEPVPTEPGPRTD